MRNLLTTTALILTLATAGASFAQPAPHDGPGGHGFMEEALDKLPPADAAKFRESMKASHEQDKGQMKHIHALHEELATILKAPNFDKAAFLSKSAKLQQLEAAHHQAMTKAFADAVATLPQDERVTLAENLHPHREHGGHHDHQSPDAPDAK